MGQLLGWIGSLLLALLLMVAAFAPLLAPYDPHVQVGLPFEHPSWAHPLGTNDIGQDLLSELVFGARVSLLVGMLAALVATLIGTTVGLVAGFFRGPVDALLMRLVDVLLALPFLPLTIVVGVFVGPGLASQIAVIGAVSWAPAARELRAQVLSARERGFVQAARTMGANGPDVLLRHLLPTVFPLVIPHFVRAVAAAILLEASLSFLGLGDPTSKSWGTMLFYAHARSAFLTDAWRWWVVPPGLAIAATVLAFGVIGYALEERLQPRLRAGWLPEARWPVRRGVSSIWQAPGPDQPLLAIEDLVVEYPTPPGCVRAVDGVCLSLRPGQVLGIVGESGSGKSSLVAAVLRLVRPPGRVVSGRVHLGGQNLLALAPAELRRVRGGRVGLIPQGAMNALNPVFTVLDQLAEAVLVHQPVSRDAAYCRAQALLELVSLPPDRARDYPHELSGGMRQRVVIAMALANEPWVVIADEPTTGLDVPLQAEILALLKELQQRLGLALLFISHDLGAVLRVADHVAVMAAGKVVEAGPAADMVARPEHAITQRLVAAIPRLQSAPRVVTSAEAPLLQVEDVRKSFPARGRGGRRVALDGVSLCVEPGQIVGLVGASGAGKTTLARLILALERADSGRILFEGRDLERLSGAEWRAALRRLHLIFQDPYDALPPHLRVRQIVEEPLVIQRLGRRAERLERVHAALEEVGLAPPDRFLDRYSHQLSGGERQRVAFARALVLRPRLLVADEPTSMLDVTVRAELVDLMRHLRERHGLAYLYITHDLALASQLCDRLVVLGQGRVVENGPTAEVIEHPRHPQTALLVQAAAALAPAEPTWLVA